MSGRIPRLVPASFMFCASSRSVPFSRLQRTAGHLVREKKFAMSSTTSNRPTGLIAKEGIELLTFGTPNGFKASILLEELKEAYGKNYVFQSINIMENIQKEPWFTKLGPNGRIPVIVDHDKGGHAVMEGAAILAYLTRHYDPESRFTFEDPLELSQCEQWVAWQHGGLGPMQGQAGIFLRFAKEKIPFGIQRYIGETERLMGVLNTRLEGRDYLVGEGRGKYSIADIASFGWANGGYFSGVDLKAFPNLYAWLERISARPAVQKGISVPSPPKMTYTMYEKMYSEDAEFRAKEDELKELIKKSKEQYNYVYKSP